MNINQRRTGLALRTERRCMLKRRPRTTVLPLDPHAEANGSLSYDIKGDILDALRGEFSP